MKVLILLTAFALGLVRTDASENLLVNGDFATNALPPWTSTGTFEVTANTCILKGISSIEQTVTTKPGARYYLAASASSTVLGTQFVMSAKPTAGGAEDTIYVFPTRINGFNRYHRVFTATTTSTRISFIMTLDTMAVGLDNIVLYELTVPSRFAGVYTGAVSISLKSPAGAHTRSATTAAAEIDDDGKITLHEGTSRIHAGILFDDATSDLFFPGLVHDQPGINAKGRDLSITFREDLKPLLDGGDVTLAADRKLAFKLRRQPR